MKFEQFEVGQRFAVGPAEVSEQSILDFARAWDPQWFHTDPAAADAGLAFPSQSLYIETFPRQSLQFEAAPAPAAPAPSSRRR